MAIVVDDLAAGWGSAVLSFDCSIIAAYSAGAHARQRHAVVALAALLAANLVDAFGAPGNRAGNVALGVVVFSLVPWLVGQALRRERQRTARMHELAEQLEAEREQRAREAVTAERGRIARELHDSVAHAISVIAIQADAAGKLLRHDPEQARESLDTVQATARGALAEMRQLVGLLRESEAREDAPLKPQPGIADVERLVDDAERSGLAVELEIDGTRTLAPTNARPRLLSDSAGGPDQRPQARRRSARAGQHPLRPRSPRHRGPRRRPRFDRGRRRWPWAGRGAGTRHPARWPPRGRPGKRRRLRSPRAATAYGAGSMTRVLLVDDQALVRQGFRLILELEKDIDVVGEAADGAEALRLARALEPDVAVMDIRMPELDGIETTRRLQQAGSQTRVLILTTFDLNEYVYEAMRAGASGFLLKDVPSDQLIAGIRTVAAGDALLAPTLTRRLIEHFVHRPPPDAAPPRGLDELTERELGVLTLLARGLSNSEIAAAVFLGEATIKTHVGRILQKLGLRDRVQAVVYAYESGLIQPGSTTDPS